MDECVYIVEAYHSIKILNFHFPVFKILLIVHQDHTIVFGAFHTGIVDYLMKSAPKEEIIEAIYSAANNQWAIRPITAEKIRQEFARIKKSKDHIFLKSDMIKDIS
ncbi:response regulator transcription factor [Neobacillus niacini]|uniref:response regulator transcription factor n=1 Tax=Neobacillus niacini TaxID=86668 RepID=UPI00147260FA|nr:response regulator transcription factor [Neobacillus niacini]